MCRISGICIQHWYREIDILHNYTHFLQNCPEFFYLPDNGSVIAQKACNKTEFTCCTNLYDNEYHLYHAPIPQEEQISGYSPSNSQILLPLPKVESLLVATVVWPSQQPGTDADGSRSDIPPSRRQQWPTYPCQYISQETASCFSKIWPLWYFSCLI